MKLSTRTRYGIRAVIELAQHKEKRPLQLKLIAERQGISIKYLEQLMSVLRSSGFIRSIRGSRGGYKLARSAEDIKLSEIFRCLEGPVTTAECTEDKDSCERAADCVAREVWVQVEEAIHGVLDSITLGDLVKRVESPRFNYQI
jgi:Rrf2 family transcriptional regulator, cysteine metabolism repressor